MEKTYKEFEDFMKSKHDYTEDGTQKYYGITSFIIDNFGQSTWPLFSIYFHWNPNPKSKKYQDARDLCMKEYLLFQILTLEELEYLSMGYSQRVQILLRRTIV